MTITSVAPLVGIFMRALLGTSSHATRTLFFLRTSWQEQYVRAIVTMVRLD